MSADYDKLKQDESDKSSKLQDLMSVSKYNHPIKNLKNLLLTKNNKTPPPRPFSHSNNFSNYYQFNDDNFKDDDDDYDDFINDEFELMKIRKNLLNSSQCSLDKFAYQNNSCLTNLRNNLKSNSKSSILSSFLSAIPTLHLHLLLSLTMVLLTHRCPPQYLIVL